MVSEPKVSVITTVYNAVATVEQTILSVLGQTYTNVEYIVIDGGSDDGTLEIIKKYQDRIAIITSGPDNGIADGFNKGIRLARGEWIGMINADDWFVPDAIEKTMINVSVDDDVCCGDLVLVGNDMQKVRKSKVGWLNLGMYIMHPTCFVRAEVYRQTGLYDTRFKIAMDFDMFMRIKQKGFSIKYVEHVIAYMRLTGASNNTKAMHLEEFAVMKKYLHGYKYLISYVFKHLNKVRCRYFFKDPLRVDYSHAS